MKRIPFLEKSDRHDLFEKIKKVSPSSEIADKDVQELLNFIEKKFSHTHKTIWDNIITVSFAGSSLKEISMLMDGFLQTVLPNFYIIEVNRQNHFIRYVPTIRKI